MQTQEPSVLCTKVQKLCAATRYSLQQLEEGAAYSFPTPQAEDDARLNLSSNINAVFQELAVLDRVLASYSGQKSEYYRKKSVSLTNDAMDLRKSIERYLNHSHAVRRRQKERETLLGGRQSTTENVAVDAFLQERDHIMSSHTMMDEITSTAENVMSSLRSQRGMIKSVHKKVLDVGTLLGLSSSLLKIIQGRTKNDRFLVYGGMVVMILFVFFLSWYTKK